MRKLRKAISALTISLLAVALSETSQGISAHADAAIAEKKEIVKIGTVDDYLPCSDQIDDNFEGLSIDIWRRISERLNLQYTLSAIPSFDEAVNLAAEGQFDIIASCHEVTPERLKLVEYAIPYTTGGIVIASQQSNRPVLTLIGKIFQNKIVVRCSILLLIVTGITAWTSSYFKKPRNSRKSKARRLTKAWTFLILNDGIDTIVGRKIRDHLTVLATSLLHTLLMSAIIGTTAAIIFEEKVARKTNELTNKELLLILKQGLAVQEGTSNANWLKKQMRSAGITPNREILPLYADSKAQMIEFLQGKQTRPAKHFVANITTYKTLLKQSDLQEKYQLTYQLPSKTPQAFLFGGKVKPELKKMINIEIAKMNRQGLTEQIEKDWSD